MMRRHRHSAVAFLRLAAMMLSRHRSRVGARATVYPERVIKMIVPSPAGGQTDVMARLMAQKMQQSLGQSVIIGSNRRRRRRRAGARTAAAAEPDGYTLFYGNTSTLAVIPAVYDAGYDPVKTAPVAERCRKAS